MVTGQTGRNMWWKNREFTKFLSVVLFPNIKIEYSYIRHRGNHIEVQIKFDEECKLRYKYFEPYNTDICLYFREGSPCQQLPG